MSAQPVGKICSLLFLHFFLLIYFNAHCWLYFIYQMFQLSVYQWLVFFIIYSSHKICSLFGLRNSAPLSVSSSESLHSFFVESGNICCSYRDRKQFILLAFFLSRTIVVQTTPQLKDFSYELNKIKMVPLFRTISGLKHQSLNLNIPFKTEPFP